MSAICLIYVILKRCPKKAIATPMGGVSAHRCGGNDEVGCCVVFDGNAGGLRVLFLGLGF